MSPKESIEVDVNVALQRLKTLGFGHNKSSIWEEGGNFYCGLSPEKFEKAVPKPPPKRSKKAQEGSKTTPGYLILGFDTEFQTAANPISHSEILDGTAELHNRILSYQ